MPNSWPNFKYIHCDRAMANTNIQTTKKQNLRFNPILFADISVTDRAVLEMFDEFDARMDHVIPEYNPKKLKGRVQRAVAALRSENERNKAIRALRGAYTVQAKRLIDLYFKMMRTKGKQESIVNQYCDHLYAILDVEMMDIVRNKLSDIPSLAEGHTSMRGGSVRTDTVAAVEGYTVCDVCGNDNEANFITDKNEQKSCKICFAVVNQLADAQGVHHPLHAAHPTADLLASFRETIKRHQGNKTVILEEELLNKVRDTLAEYNIDPKDSKRQDIMRCLMDNKMSSVYKDVVQIHTKISGKRTEFSHKLEEVIIDDFCTLLDVSDEPLEHLQFLLYLLLKRHDPQGTCIKNFPTTSDFRAVDLNYEVYINLFKKLGWSYAGARCVECKFCNMD